MNSQCVSVIVPVFNDAPRLRLCLEALMKQTYSSDCYEVIVVDNGSRPDERIPETVAEFSLAVYAFESSPGAYAARNCGLKVAQGEILAFTDADCVPAPNWLEKGVAHLVNKPGCGLVAGRVDLFFKAEHANPVELYESVTAFPQERLLTQQHGAATANVFTFSAVIEAVGAFDSSLRSQGDLEWGQRVYAAGYQQVYADDVRVAHPARHTLEQLRKRTVRLAGGTFGRLVRSEPDGLRRELKFARLLLEDLLPPVNFALSALRDDRLKGVREKVTVPMVLVWVRCISAVEKIRLRFGGVPSRG